jgi:cell division protein FtsA
LTEQQTENGVAVIDMGGATTSVAIFEEGDLQYIAVIPFGGVTLTNDLAIGLKTDPEIAEKVKLAHGSAVVRSSAEDISIKHEKELHRFNTADVDEIIEARLDEIFDLVQKEFKKAGKAGQLPSGVVLTGGTAKLKGVADYTKEKLGLAARVGKSSGFGGVAEHIDEPQYATAVGLMLIDAQGTVDRGARAKKPGVHGKQAIKQASGFVSKFLGRFKA